MHLRQMCNFTEALRLSEFFATFEAHLAFETRLIMNIRNAEKA